MNKNFLFCLLAVSIPLVSLAQSARFVYADSFSSVGVSPVSAQYITQYAVKRILLYHMTKDRKDSVLYKTCYFDTQGNLTKEILHGKPGVAFIDSMIYDNQNRKKSHYSKARERVYYQSNIYYYGDSLVRTNAYYAMNDAIDTIYRFDFFDKNKLLLYSKYLNSKNEFKSITEYSYTSNGLPVELKVTDFVDSNMSYGYQYEHSFSKNGRRMILWNAYLKNKRKVTECFYNAKNQCTKCVTYSNNSDSFNRFIYRADGGLFEHIYEYTNMYNNRLLSVVSRYYYYQ